MKTKVNATGFWWIPDGEKLFGTLTFDENNGGLLSVYGRFPDMSDDEKERFNYPLILGETDDEQLFTLRNCSLKTSYPYMRNLSRSDVNVDTVLIGHHFETVDSMQFDKFSIVYSNVDRVVSPIARPISFGKRAQIMEIPVKDICIIRVFAETNVKMMKPGPGTSIYVECDFEITSLREKTFEKYRELYNLLLDFFNFYITDDVDLVDVTAFYSKESIDTMNEIKILYRYPDLTGLNKPINNVNFYMEMKYCLWIPHLISKWYEVILSNKFETVFNLYLGVIVSGSAMFLEFQFLALAQALETYHSITIGDASVHRMKRKEGSEKIMEIIKDHMPQMEEWVKAMIKNSVNPSLQERLKEIFDIFQDFCYAFLKFNNKQLLANKIRDSRHYFTHWANDLKKKAAKDDELYHLTKDVQFILRLCLMSEVGFDLVLLEKVFCLEKMVEVRRTRENEKIQKT